MLQHISCPPQGFDVIKRPSPVCFHVHHFCFHFILSEFHNVFCWNCSRQHSSLDSAFVTKTVSDVTFLMSLFLYTCVLYVLMMLGFGNIVITCVQKKGNFKGVTGESHRRVSQESPGVLLRVTQSQADQPTSFFTAHDRPVSSLSQRQTHFLSIVSMLVEEKKQVSLGVCHAPDC